MARPDLTLWAPRIEAAQSLQVAQHKRWRECQWMLEGSWFEKQGLSSDPDSTPVNYATAYHKTILAAIYARDPSISVKSRNKSFYPFAESMDRVLNYFWDELRLKKQAKRAIVNAIPTGIGWVEVGYTANFETLVPPQQPDGFTTLLKKLSGDNKTASQQGVLSEYLRSQSPYAVTLSSWKVFLAPGYHDVSQMPYLLVAEDISPEDLKNHPLYSKHFDLNHLKATRTVQTGDRLITAPKSAKSVGQAAELEMVRLWHVHDRRNQERWVCDATYDQMTPIFPWSWDFDGFQQVPLIFNEMPETDRDANSYPQSDLWPMLPQLKELHRLRTAMVRHRKRSGSVIIVRKGSTTEEQKRNLQTGQDVAIVEVDDTTGVISFAPPSLPPDVYRIGERILQDLDLVGGLTQVLLGTPAAKDTTATEINAQTSGTTLRTSEKVDVIEEWSGEVARKLSAVIWCYAPRETIRQLLGETALTESLWPSLPEDPEERRQIIQQELEFEIEAGSTKPMKDKTIEREQKIRVVNVIGAFAPERLKKGEWVKQLAKDTEFKEIELLVITDDQSHQQDAMAENELLLQNFPQHVGTDELDEIHIAAHQAGIEQAGGMSTPAMDQHILDHARRLQEKDPKRKPQQGDVMPAGGGVKPEQLRQGTPTAVDLSGPATRSLSEPGQEKGGLKNGA